VKSKISESNRLTTKLTQFREQKKKALVLFLTAGYPKLDSMVPMALELAHAGADIIEIGMPFSDPLADGPIIQASSQQAIKNGITLGNILDQVKEIRKHTDIPLVLMGYLNPILHYSEEKFFADARKVGVDGIILPEVPLEESKRYITLTETVGLANIMLVTPTTPPERIVMIDKASNGFLYCVSIVGVTGSSVGSMKENYVSSVKRSAKKNPVIVGFGIKTPEDVKRISQFADGVIVASALIQKIAQGETQQQLGNFVRQLKEAI
jgi:tryptophan synthase alpha chain